MSFSTTIALLDGYMYRMTKEELQKFIDTVQFPILTSGENPQQLYLYNGGQYVASYDPVWSMKIVDDKLVIIGFLERQYEHSLSSFDSIKLEPYVAD